VADTPKTVTALAPDGTPIELPSSEAGALNRGQEGRVLSDAEAAKVRHQVELQKKYEGVEGYVAPPLVGAARGLSFGLSDLMLSESPALQKRLADYEEYAPQATATGEVAGLVGGSLFGVGAAGAAGKLGRTAEGLVASGIGEESAMARAASRIAGTSAAGAVENGLYEAGKAASDSAIADEPLTAEKLVAGAKHGVLLGGGIGAVLGAGGALLRRGAHAPASLADVAAPESLSEATATTSPTHVPYLSESQLDAGLSGRLPKAESPLSIGGEFATLKPGGRISKLPTEDAFAIRRGVTIDPDAGLRGPLDEGADNAIHPTGKMRDVRKTQRVSLDDIEPTEVWDQTKLPRLRERLAAGEEIDPIRLGKGEDGQWKVVDGIHRIAANKEAGAADILARTSEPHYPQKLNNDVFNLQKGVDVEGGAYRDYADARLIDPEAGIARKGQNGKFQGKLPTEDAVIPANRNGIRRVDLADLSGVEPFDIGEGPIDVGALRPSVPEPVRPVGEALAPKGTIGDYIAKTADVKTIKALGGSAGDLRALEGSVKGGFRRVAQDIRSDVEATTGKSFGLHSRSSLNEYATKRVDELGDKLGGMLERLDEGSTGIAPKPDRLIDQVRNDIIKPNLIQKADGSFVTLPGQEKVVNAVEGWLGRIQDAFTDRAPTFKEWQRIRVGLDKEINYAAAKVSPKAEALRQLRSAIEDELVKSGEAAASSMGSSFQSEYQATKSLYQSVKKAAELTTRGVSRDLANNSLGLTSRIAGIAGASVGGMAGGIAAGLAGKIIQSHGDQLAADLLSRAASMNGVQRLVGQVSRELDTGVSKLVGKQLPRVTAGIPVAEAASDGRSKVSQREKFAQLSDVIAKASANPAATVDRVERSLGALADHAPRTANEVVMTTIRGADFLASKLPPSRQDQYSLQPQFQIRSRASDAEISQFMRYAQAVDDPLIVLREAKSGTLTRAHVEAVQAVYPKLYDEIRGTVFRSLVESKSEIPYARRIQLGILLDLPTDKTLSPEFREAIQATYNSADQAQAESPPTTSAAPEIAASFQTATERATERAA
jgi:hypothetical protein